MKQLKKITKISITILLLSFCIGCSFNPFNDKSKENDESNHLSSKEKNDNSDNEHIKENTDKSFYYTEITDEIFERINNKSYKSDCIVPRKDLRYMHVLHKVKDGHTKEGELIVNYHIANALVNVFRELYYANYPIEKIELIDNYNADDNQSMLANNSSSFNYRKVSNSKVLSKHAYGLAVDINPLYNPYVTQTSSGYKVDPIEGKKYANRNLNFDYKIEPNDICVQTFKKYGFEWGGAWSSPKDYQHFEISNSQLSKWY